MPKSIPTTGSAVSMHGLLSGLLHNDGTRRHRTIAILMSLGLVLAYVAAGYVVLPPAWRSGPVPGLEYRVPPPLIDGAALRDLPVFVLQEDGFPLKAGRGLALSGTMVRITPYESFDAERAAGLEAVLFDADLKVLWTLAPDQDREELRNTALGFYDTLHDTFRKAFVSPDFDKDYGQPLGDILRGAMVKAWSAQSTQAALQAALGAIDPKALDSILADIRPVAVEMTEALVWQSVRDYASGLLHGSASVDKGTGKIIAEALRDERVKANLGRSLPVLMESKESEAFLAKFVTALTAALMEDRRLLPLLTRLLTDSKVVASSSWLSDAARTAGRVLPRKLIRLRGPRDHNALASFVVNNVARGRRAYVVVFMTRQQRMRLAAANPPGSLQLLSLAGRS